MGEPGVLHYGGDVDFFVFEAESGESHEIRVAPNTPEDPMLGLAPTPMLYDAAGLWLDSDDDSGGSLAPSLYWRRRTRVPSMWRWAASALGPTR